MIDGSERLNHLNNDLCNSTVIRVITVLGMISSYFTGFNWILRQMAFIPQRLDVPPRNVPDGIKKMPSGKTNTLDFVPVKRKCH